MAGGHATLLALAAAVLLGTTPALSAVVPCFSKACPAPTPVSAEFPSPAGGKYSYSEAIHKIFIYYWTMRSGRLPYQRLAWRTDSCLDCLGPAGEDLTGGYYEAGGSYLKIGLPNAFVTTQLAWAVLYNKDALAAVGELQEALDAVRWGADYIVAAHPAPLRYVGFQGDKFGDFQYYGPPEFYAQKAPGFSGTRPATYVNASNPGSEIAGEAAAALAAASLAFNTSDAAYSARLLSHARDLYRLANEYQGSYMNSTDPLLGVHAELYPSTGYEDELAWAALWLYQATGNASYAGDVAQYFDAALAAEGKAGYSTFGWDTKGMGVAVLAARFLGGTRYVQAATRLMNQYLPDTRIVPHTDDGMVYPYGNGWGALRYGTNAAFLAFILSDVYKANASASSQAYAAKLFNYGLSQVNYVLGDGGNHSWVVGYGSGAPKQPFHKSSWNSYLYWPSMNGSVVDQQSDFQFTDAPNRWVVYGGLVGGPFDITGKYIDRRGTQELSGTYAYTEVSIDYSSALLGPAAYLAGYFAGQSRQSDCGLDLGWDSQYASMVANRRPAYPATDCYHQCCSAGAVSSVVAAAPVIAPTTTLPRSNNATVSTASVGRKLLVA